MDVLKFAIQKNGLNEDFWSKRLANIASSLLLESRRFKSIESKDEQDNWCNVFNIDAGNSIFSR